MAMREKVYDAMDTGFVGKFIQWPLLQLHPAHPYDYDEATAMRRASFPLKK